MAPAPLVPIGRRQFTAGMAAVLAAPACSGQPSLAGELSALEAHAGGRLGIAVLSRGGRLAGYRRDERFAFCSSFKFSLAAMVLREGARGKLRLDERLAYTRADLLANSPVTEAHLGEGGMTLAALAEAAQTTSDNCAANLLLRRLGGPAALTGFWRGLGDRVSRLDDYEPALNRVAPGAVRNTTSPAAMAGVLQALLDRGGLPGAEVARLKGWMRATETGLDRLRAGLPADWVVGDKTGTGYPADLPGTWVDLAWAERPGKAPLAIAAFYQPARPTPDGDPKAPGVLAAAARIVARWAA